MKNICYIIIVTLSACYLYNCSSGNDIAGTESGSETTNGIVAARALYSDSTPVKNAVVLLRNKEFLKDTSLAVLSKTLRDSITITTNDSGWFFIDSVDTGGYYIEINSGDTLAVLIDLQVTSDTTLPVQILASTASITGNITGSLEAVYVQIYGLDRVIRIDSLGSFTFNNLPSGEYILRLLSSSGTYITDTTIQFISPSESRFLGSINITNALFEDYSAWPYSASIRLKTDSASGISEDVNNFPLLFVNYYDNIIPIDSSMMHTIRFSTLQGEPLPYHTYYYAPDSNVATSIRLNTVFAGQNDQTVIIYWGNQYAHDQSSSPEVYRTSDGYVGVWPLHENSTGINNLGVYKDLTGNNNHGDDFVMTDNKQTSYGHFATFFDSTSGDYIDCGNDISLDLEGSLMLSAWIKPVGNTIMPILSKKEAPGALSGLEIHAEYNATGVDTSLKVTITGDQPAEIDVNPLVHSSLGFIQIILTIQDSQASLFVSGTRVRSWNITPVQNDSGSFLIGKDVLGATYNGYMSAVSFSKQIRSDSWIKLKFVQELDGENLCVVE